MQLDFGSDDNDTYEKTFLSFINFNSILNSKIYWSYEFKEATEKCDLVDSQNSSFSIIISKWWLNIFGGMNDKMLEGSKNAWLSCDLTNKTCPHPNFFWEFSRKGPGKRVRVFTAPLWMWKKWEVVGYNVWLLGYM